MSAEKMRMGLARKIARPVFLVITGMFAAVMIGTVVYYGYTFRGQIANEQMRALAKEESKWGTVFRTLDNTAQQLVATDALQELDDSHTYYLIRQQNAQRVLSSYTHVLPYVEEITLELSSGDTFSTRFGGGCFERSQEWYTQFLNSDRKKGFSEVYQVQNSSESGKIAVFSYLTKFWSIRHYPEQMGILIITVRLDSVSQYFNTDDAYLVQSSLYNENGDVILQYGETDRSYGEWKSLSDGENIVGDDFVYKARMDNGWMLIHEISGRIVARRILETVAVIALVYFAVVVLTMILLYYSISNETKTLSELADAAKKIGEENYDLLINVHTGDEVQVLADSMMQMQQKIKENVHRRIENEKILRKTQIDQLMMQINPHFIYNTLNSIVYMATIDGEKDIACFTNALISLLQKTLYTKGGFYVTVEDELQIIRDYLVIQKYRYMDKFETEIICPEETLGFFIPKVVLQPIVENAIFHGIAPKEGKGKLCIKFEREKDVLRVIVTDDGVGMDEEIRSNILNRDDKTAPSGDMRKIGLANVQKRIQEICGDAYGLEIESYPDKGTKIILDVPVIKKVPEEAYREREKK